MALYNQEFCFSYKSYFNIISKILIQAIKTESDSICSSFLEVVDRLDTYSWQQAKIEHWPASSLNTREACVIGACASVTIVNWLLLT